MEVSSDGVAEGSGPRLGCYAVEEGSVQDRGIGLPTRGMRCE